MKIELTDEQVKKLRALITEADEAFAFSSDSGDWQAAAEVGQECASELELLIEPMDLEVSL